MDSNAVEKIVEGTLEKMSCTDVTFSKSDRTVSAAFNCKEITSFIAEVPGWSYTGIHLDPSGERQYRIEFKKES